MVPQTRKGVVWRLLRSLLTRHPHRTSASPPKARRPQLLPCPLCSIPLPGLIKGLDKVTSAIHDDFLSRRIVRHAMAAHSRRPSSGRNVLPGRTIQNPRVAKHRPIGASAKKQDFLSDRVIHHGGLRSGVRSRKWIRWSHVPPGSSVPGPRFVDPDGAGGNCPRDALLLAMPILLFRNSSFHTGVRGFL